MTSSQRAFRMFQAEPLQRRQHFSTMASMHAGTTHLAHHAGQRRMLGTVCCLQRCTELDSAFQQAPQGRVCAFCSLPRCFFFLRSLSDACRVRRQLVSRNPPVLRTICAAQTYIFRSGKRQKDRAVHRTLDSRSTSPTLNDGRDIFSRSWLFRLTRKLRLHVGSLHNVLDEVVLLPTHTAWDCSACGSDLHRRQCGSQGSWPRWRIEVRTCLLRRPLWVTKTKGLSRGVQLVVPCAG